MADLHPRRPSLADAVRAWSHPRPPPHLRLGHPVRRSVPSPFCFEQDVAGESPLARWVAAMSLLLVFGWFCTIGSVPARFLGAHLRMNGMVSRRWSGQLTASSSSIQHFEQRAQVAVVCRATSADIRIASYGSCNPRCAAARSRQRFDDGPHQPVRAIGRRTTLAAARERQSRRGAIRPSGAAGRSGGENQPRVEFRPPR